MNPDIIVIHETNGKKYFEALSNLSARGRLGSVTFVEASVVWKLLHSIVRERRPLRAAISQALKNLWFRITCYRLKDRVIIIGLPPWDFRFVLYSALRRRNRVIYHTSWPNWSRDRVPRRNGIAGGALSSLWRSILREPDVEIVAVTQASATGVSQFASGKLAAEIPHVVSDAFFEQTARYRNPFHILFVGELVEHRGLGILAEALERVRDSRVTLDIVGDGPLRDTASKMTQRYGGTWYRRIESRSEMARVMASSQLFVSPSFRTERWEELFGMAIVEAMACAVPCIASDHLGPRSVIDHEVNGIIVPERSPDIIARWIDELSGNEAKWKAISDAARTRAQLSKLEAVAKRWESILCHLPNDHEPLRPDTTLS